MEPAKEPHAARELRVDHPSCSLIYVKVIHFAFVLQGLIFVVDSNDRERVAEAADELAKMVRIIVAEEHA